MSALSPPTVVAPVTLSSTAASFSVLTLIYGGRVCAVGGLNDCRGVYGARVEVGVGLWPANDSSRPTDVNVKSSDGIGTVGARTYRDRRRHDDDTRCCCCGERTRE